MIVTCVTWIYRHILKFNIYQKINIIQYRILSWETRLWFYMLSITRRVALITIEIYILMIYRWASARQKQNQCVCNGGTYFLHLLIDMSTAKYANTMKKHSKPNRWTYHVRIIVAISQQPLEQIPAVRHRVATRDIFSLTFASECLTARGPGFTWHVVGKLCARVNMMPPCDENAIK